MCVQLLIQVLRVSHILANVEMQVVALFSLKNEAVEMFDTSIAGIY